MDLSSTPWQITQLIASILFGWIILKIYRWVRLQSQTLGLVLAAGICVRAFLGTTLFLISYFQLPIATSLQSGDGFWQTAPDARSYYEYAAASIGAGTLFHDPTAPSPFFITVLALWMNIVGVTPIAAAFLNLCLYTVLIWVLVWYFQPVNNWRRDLPCIVAAAAYSFSPVILIHTTQPLKDGLSVVLVAMASLGVLSLSRIIYTPSRTPHFLAMTGGLLALLAAIFAVAGIRWYFALMIWCVLAFVFALFTLRGRSTPLPEYLVRCLLILIILLLGFWAGAGPHSAALLSSYQSKGSLNLTSMPAQARTGFLATGGGTNIVIPVRDDSGSRVDHPPAPPSAPPKDEAPLPEAPSTDTMRAVPTTIPEHLKAIGAGLALVFLPISLVGGLFEITIPGGRGLLWIADLDTMFQDVAIILMLALLWQRRGLVGERLPFVAFGLILSVLSAVLLGYVVTNFGTLWRLRTLVVAPLWVLAVAVSHRHPPSPHAIPASLQRTNTAVPR